MALRLPCIFETQKTTGRSVRHLGWLPYELAAAMVLGEIAPRTRNNNLLWLL